MGEMTWQAGLSAYGEPMPGADGSFRGELRTRWILSVQDSGGELALPWWYCAHVHGGPDAAQAARTCAAQRLKELEDEYKTALLEQARRIDRGQGGQRAAEELFYNAIILGMERGRYPADNR